MTDAMKAVDRSQPADVALIQTLDLLEEHDRARAAPLRSSPHAVEVFARALAVFATASDAVDWLRRQNLALPRRSGPAQLIDGAGRDLVVTLLDKIEQWDYRMTTNP